jgi:glycosyltransferase involved in cell wall biosynthesis
MRLADVLLLYTDAERDQFIKRGFVSHRVFATNNSIGSAEIKEAKNYWLAPRLQRFQEAQSIKDREILLFCGRLTLKSEFLLLLEALSEVAKLHPAVTLAVVGDGELRSSAQGRSEALGISDRVIWLGEVHEERQLAPWFLSSKALIYPGSIGLSLLHALNYGLPVITHATIRRHNPEISALEHGVNGFMFADGNVGALAASIVELLNDPERRQRMSEAALQTVEGRYSTERMVNGFVDAVHAARRSALDRVGAVNA